LGHDLWLHPRPTTRAAKSARSTTVAPIHTNADFQVVKVAFGDRFAVRSCDSQYDGEYPLWHSDLPKPPFCCRPTTAVKALIIVDPSFRADI
jgi:hypothetical protein